VVSELIKSQKNDNVVNWIEKVEEDRLYISVLTLGEIKKGIAKLPESKKKNALIDWVENDLKFRFLGRVLEITEDIALKWGEITGSLEKQGKKIPVIDGLIAATGILNNMQIVTRNVRDLENTSCHIFNPWEN
jgi:predicted nucleic acid-binding protein